MKIKTLISVSMLMFSVIVSAQIKVATNNNVGIGTTTPQSKLSVNSDGNSLYETYFSTSGAQRATNISLVNPTSSNYNVALAVSIGQYSTGFKNVALNVSSYQSSGTHSKRTFGIRSNAGNGASGYNYAVLGILYGDRNGAGIVGSLASEPYIDGKYAGYFQGNVKITSVLYCNSVQSYSDERLKSNIVSISSKEGISEHITKLSKLSAIRYNLIDPSILEESNKTDTISSIIVKDPSINQEYTRDRIGLSAQEIQKVYPEIVMEDTNGYLSVDYMGLIPILVEAIKEQQYELENQSKEIAELRKLVEGLLSTEKE